jgi:hypothetical protein
VGDVLATKVTTMILLEELLILYRLARPAMPSQDGKDTHNDGKTANDPNDAESRTDRGFVLEKAGGGIGAGGSGSNGKGRTSGSRSKSGGMGVWGFDKRCRWTVPNAGYGTDRGTD